MRIAYVSLDPGVPVFGCKGCSVHVQEVVRELVRRGHSVTLFSPCLAGAVPADLTSVRRWLVPFASGAAGADRERAALRMNARVLDGLAGQLSGGFDLVYERYSLWSHATMEWAAAHGRPSLLEVNAPLVDEQRRHRVLHLETAARQSTARVLAAASGIVAVSEPVADWVRGQGVDPRRVRVVPNGVSPARFAGSASAVPAPPSEFTVGFVGTLKPWHGVDRLIEAFARLRSIQVEARLRLVGDGPERDRLAALAFDLGVAEAVDWAGAVDPADVPSHLARMDVAVAPYPEIEGFYFSPLKLLEYMAAGRAIVASRMGQIRTLIRNGVDGWLVPPGDVPALAGALMLLSQRPGLRRRLGCAARLAAERRHSWTQVVQRSLALAAATAPAAGARGLGLAVEEREVSSFPVPVGCP